MPLGWYYRDKGVRYRFSEEGHLDLCDWLADHGATRPGKLDAVARLIGLPGKVGIDWLAGRGPLPRRPARDDPEVLPRGRRADRVPVPAVPAAQGQLGAEAYRGRAAALLEALAADGRVGEVLSGLDRDRLLAGPPPARAGRPGGSDGGEAPAPDDPDLP